MHLHSHSTSYIYFMHHCMQMTNFRGADLVRKVSLVHKQVFATQLRVKLTRKMKRILTLPVFLNCRNEQLVKTQKKNVK